MPFGAIMKFMVVMALIGLGVALAIGVTMFVLPVLALGVIGMLIYRWNTARVRHRPQPW